VGSGPATVTLSTVVMLPVLMLVEPGQMDVPVASVRQLMPQ
jgi:hypothetical protein